MSAHPARLKLTAYTPPEDDLHEATARALDLLLLPPACWSTFPAGGYLLTPAARARLFRLGLKPAWPDVLIVHTGSVFGIELKIPGGVLSKTRIVHGKRGRARVVMGQVEMHPLLMAAGMRLAVCRSVDDVLSRCRDWGLPLRPHT